MEDEEKNALKITLSPDIDTLYLRNFLEEDKEAEDVEVLICTSIFFGQGASLFRELIEWFTIVGQVLQKLKHLKVRFSINPRSSLFVNHRRTFGIPLKALCGIFRLRSDTLLSCHFDLREVSVPLVASDDADCCHAAQQIGEAKKLERFLLAANSMDAFPEHLWSALDNLSALCDVSVRINGAPRLVHPNSALITLCQQSNSRSKPPLSLCLGNCNFLRGVLQTMYSDKKSRLAALKLKQIPSLNKALIEAAVGLRENRTMKSLQFWHPDQELAHLAPYGLATTLLKALEKNTELESLSIGIVLSSEDPHGRKLLEAVKKMGKPLKNLELCLKMDPSEDDNLPLFQSVATLLGGLAHNDSLANIHICMCFNDSLVAVSRAYGFNEKLTRTLQTNTTLERVKLSQRLGWDEPEPLKLSYDADFWLVLNRLGRTCSFEKKELWVEAMVEYREDPSILYHLILNNPLFLFSSTSDDSENLGGGPPPRPQKKKQKLNH